MRIEYLSVQNLAVTFISQSSHGKSIGPLACGLSVLLSIVLVKVCNVGHKGVIGVGICEQ